MTDYQPTPPPSPYGNGNYGAPVQRTNTLAIVGFILAFVVNIAGLVVSIIAFNQIKRTGEGGRGLALAGIIISIVSLVLSVFIIIAEVAFLSALAHSGQLSQ